MAPQNGLLHETQNQLKWLPNSVSMLENIASRKLNTNLRVSGITDIRKNVVYNLQYLEYLDETTNQLNLTSVLLTQTWKVFVITTISVTEAIFFCLLKEKGYQSTTNWERIKKTAGTTFNHGGKLVRVENILYEKLPSSIDTEMTFDQMLSKVSGKKLLGNNFQHYSTLRKLKRLRNKIHIYSVESSGVPDTDYMNFKKQDFNNAKEALWEILRVTFRITQAESNNFMFLR